MESGLAAMTLAQLGQPMDLPFSALSIANGNAQFNSALLGQTGTGATFNVAELLDETLLDIKPFNSCQVQNSPILDSPVWDTADFVANLANGALTDSDSVNVSDDAQLELLGQQQQQQKFSFDLNSQHQTATYPMDILNELQYWASSPDMPPSPYSPSIATSDPPSPAYSANGCGGGKSGPAIPDGELVQLPVRELNKVIKTLQIDNEAVARLKQRRRTLKNRGYAQNCRQRRQALRSNIETHKESLEVRLLQCLKELSTIKKQNEELRRENEAMKKQGIAAQ